MALYQRQRSRGNPSRQSRLCHGEYLIHKPELTKRAMLALPLVTPHEVGTARGTDRKEEKTLCLSPLHVQGAPSLVEKEKLLVSPVMFRTQLESSGTTSRNPGPWPPRRCHAAVDIPW
ncbi:uncharacterized protein TrAtP1_003357 [Trichoderma atroviride]|uniref:uncharacterized protein n=1 Tax=Hypocrea atroviridis TaxID=63577 RepID=UPI003332843A|nr:hypothetical protein TrAtP1_003357 [Trichoderma atroviride]